MREKNTKKKRMKKILVAVLTVLCYSYVIVSCSKDEIKKNEATPTVTDTDGNIYHTVTIGTQTWMVENLKTTKYNDGTNIQFRELNVGAYDYWHENGISTNDKYGALYNCQAVNTGKLAPKGWHVPTVTDWENLEAYLGGSSVAGGKLKSKTEWAAPNTGASNESGLTALPGGLLTSLKTNSILYSGYWWSSTDTGAKYTSQRYFYLSYNSTASDSQGYLIKSAYLSVRCIKD
jgi:uncharacterized protein (TIGR02145 family)